MKKDTFNTSFTKLLESDVSEVIPLKLIQNGRFLAMQVLSVTDETTAPARIDIGYQRGASFVPLKSFTTPAAGFTVCLETTVFMRIDDLPACRIITGMTGDHIQIACAGYVLYADDNKD